MPRDAGAASPSQAQAIGLGCCTTILRPRSNSRDQYPKTASPNRRMALAKGDEAASHTARGTKAALNTFAARRPAMQRGNYRWIPRRQVVFAVAFYCLCSSSLLFLNKLAVNGFPSHTLKTRGRGVQIAFATAACKALAVWTWPTSAR